MTGVIERLGHAIIGERIVYSERPMAWEQADDIAGRRLDRRKNYAVINGQVCSAIRWTVPCSGCSGDIATDRGSGCHECGYTGRSRMSQWFPDDGSEPNDGGAR